MTGAIATNDHLFADMLAEIIGSTDTRMCWECKETRSRIWYSMTPGLFDSRHEGGQHPVCNPCQIMSQKKAYKHVFSAPADPEGWREFARCGPKIVPTEKQAEVRKIMDPTTQGQRTARKWVAYCRTCPVKRDCADFGEASGSSGVWGGEYRYGIGETIDAPAATDGRRVRHIKSVEEKLDEASRAKGWTVS